MGEDRSPAIPIRSFPSGKDASVQRYHTSAFRRGWLLSVSLGLLVSLLTLGLWQFDLLQEFEMRTLDARFRWRGSHHVKSPLAIVFIGDDSIQEFGRWPWSWDHHALLIDTLNRAGARLILFDIFFTESPGKSEAGLLGAVAGRAGNVYFCSFFNGFEKPEESDGPFLLKGMDLKSPVPELLSAAAGVGHCNALPDLDGNTRRVPLLVRHEGELFPAALLEVAVDFLGTSIEEIGFPDEGTIELGRPAGTSPTIPVDDEGQTMANFTGGLEAFPSYSYRQVLQADRFPGQAAVDLEAFRDRIVLVGVTFTGNTDLRPTPFSPTYPMIGIQATLLDNILSGEFIRRPPRAVTILLWLALGGLTGGLAFAFRPLMSLAITIVTGAVYLVGAVTAFTGMRLHLELVGPLTAVILTYLAVTTIQYIETRQQKMRYLERMKYLGHLVESSNEAIISFDTKGRVVSWNHGAREIYGYREGEVMERRWHFLVVPEEREQLESLFLRTLNGEEVENQELKFEKNDGSPIPVSASFSQIRDSRGDLVGVSLISQDLSEKKKMIEMLIQSEKLAEIGRMGSGIVHEIKNPLTSIMMMSSILTADKTTPAKIVKYAEIIEKESQRILRLSQNILSFARPQKPEMKSTDLNGTLEATLDLVEYELKKAKVAVRRELHRDLPPVWGDQEKLKQVFLNIITNACHAMEGGGALIVRTFPGGRGTDPEMEPAPGWHHCGVGEVDKDQLVVSRVEDRGPGIPPDILDKIFEPFFSTKGEGKGTGLGLYISRNIILEHHGRMTVQSREGGGTIFTIFLPVPDSS